MSSPPPLTLLVLAAGMGSRYGGLKQIDPVGPHRELLLDYSIFDAIRAGYSKVVFVIRREIETDFKHLVVSRIKDKIDVELVFQDMSDLPAGFSVPEGRVKPWGTGHAVRAARNAIDGPFAAINADDFYGAGAYRKLADWLRATGTRILPDGRHQFSLVAYRLLNTLSEHGYVSRGICHMRNTGALDSVVETVHIEQVDGQVQWQDADGEVHPLTGGEPVSLNFWGFTPGIFSLIEEQFTDFLTEKGGDLKSEFYIPAVVDTAIQRDQAEVCMLTTDEQWIGVTYPDDKPVVVQRIRKLIDDGKYPDNLWGVHSL